jgi:enoyl-CoA hydratase
MQARAKALFALPQLLKCGGIMPNFINVSVSNGVATVALNRPAAMNALCRELNLELLEAIRAVSTERVLILTGGPKVFAAGADVAAMRDATPLEAYQTSEIGHLVHDTLESLPIPTIAAVNGFALGGGCELAMACDFRIAGESASFALPEVGLGVIPGAGGAKRLIQLVGLSLAREMILLGRRLSGPEAFQAGLCNKCVADSDVIGEASDMAQKLCKRPAVALGLAKRAINASDDSPEIEKLLFSLAFASPDQKEGMSALLEKRKPVFKHE